MRKEPSSKWQELFITINKTHLLIKTNDNGILLTQPKSMIESITVTIHSSSFPFQVNVRTKNKLATHLPRSTDLPIASQDFPDEITRAFLSSLAGIVTQLSAETL